MTYGPERKDKMRYYVCNSPDPLEVPWGIGINMHPTEATAIMHAKDMAEREPGVAWYVHAFPVSVATFRVKGRVEMEMEYLGDSQ